MTNIIEKEKRPRRDTGRQVIHIISQVYNASHPAKRYENERALIQNVLNPVVAAVHVLPERVEDYHYARRVAAAANASHKVVMGISLDRRMNYTDAFRYANEHLAGRYVSIQHADVFLDPITVDDAYLFDAFLDRPDTALAMSRHEDPGCVLAPGDHHDWSQRKPASFCYKYRGPYSHDAFLFRAPIPNIRFEYLNFLPNHLGAENVVLFELLIGANMTVYNPCQRYRIMHVDCNRGLIQGGVKFTTAGPRINHKPFHPATYQRFASAYPTSCRNTVGRRGLHPKSLMELEEGREHFQRIINGTRTHAS